MDGPGLNVGVEHTKLTRILNAMDDGVYIVNPQYEIEYSNPVLEREFGPVQARKCYEYFHGLSAPCSWCRNQQVFEGESFHWLWHSEETGKTYDLFDTPVVNDAGITCKLEFFHDITEHQRAKEELRASEDRYRLLVETMNEGLIVLDANHLCAYANDQSCRLLGRSHDEVVGRDITGFLDEENARILKEQLTLRQAGGQAGYELAWTRPDGQRILVNVSPRAIVDSEGNIAGSFGVITDITAHRRAEEALRNSERRLRFLSGEILKAQDKERTRISRELHDELGQALTVIKLRVGFLEKGLRSDQVELLEECRGLRQYVDQVTDEVRRLAHDLSPAVLDSLGFMIALRRLVADFRRCSGIECSLEADDINAFFSAASRTMLYRVFQEALTNIRKHARATKVRVSISTGATSANCSVEDNGIGLDLDRVISSTHGIGLSTMRERARLLGGSLTVSSVLGKGTKLEFVVPIELGGNDEGKLPGSAGGRSRSVAARTKTNPLRATQSGGRRGGR